MFGYMFCVLSEFGREARASREFRRIIELQRKHALQNACDGISDAEPCGLVFDTTAMRYAVVRNGKTSIPSVPRR